MRTHQHLSGRVDVALWIHIHHLFSYLWLYTPRPNVLWNAFCSHTHTHRTFPNACKVRMHKHATFTFTHVRACIVRVAIRSYIALPGSPPPSAPDETLHAYVCCCPSMYAGIMRTFLRDSRTCAAHAYEFARGRRAGSNHTHTPKYYLLMWLSFYCSDLRYLSMCILRTTRVLKQCLSPFGAYKRCAIKQRQSPLRQRQYAHKVKIYIPYIRARSAHSNMHSPGRTTTTSFNHMRPMRALLRICHVQIQQPYCLVVHFTPATQRRWKAHSKLSHDTRNYYGHQFASSRPISLDRGDLNCTGRARCLTISSRYESFCLFDTMWVVWQNIHSWRHQNINLRVVFCVFRLVFPHMIARWRHNPRCVRIKCPPDRPTKASQ